MACVDVFVAVSEELEIANGEVERRDAQHRRCAGFAGWLADSTMGESESESNSEHRVRNQKSREGQARAEGRPRPRGSGPACDSRAPESRTAGGVDVEDAASTST